MAEMAIGSEEENMKKFFKGLFIMYCLAVLLAMGEIFLKDSPGQAQAQTTKVVQKSGLKLCPMPCDRLRLQR